MAKKIVREHSIIEAITAITDAVRAETNGTLTAEEKSEAINQAMDVVDHSNIVTMGENADEAIELQHQIAEEQEENAAQDEFPGPPNGPVAPADDIPF